MPTDITSGISSAFLSKNSVGNLSKIPADCFPPIPPGIPSGSLPRFLPGISLENSSGIVRVGKGPLEIAPATPSGFFFYQELL